MKRLGAIAVMGFVFAGCGGGSAPPPAIVPTGAPGPEHNKTSVTFSVTIPKATQPAVRRPNYISTNTQSIAIQQLSANAPYTPVGNPVIANVTPSSPGCTTDSNGTSCSIEFAATPGTFNFSVQSFSGMSGQGNLLAENTLTTTTIVPGVANAVSVTLNGVIGSLTLPPAFSGTTNTPQVVDFSVQDPSGATIIGSGTYDNGPISVSDLNDLTTITPFSFSGPTTSTAFTVQCNAGGSGTIQLSIPSGVLGSIAYTCTQSTVTLTPGSLEFDALAANQSDPTFDQIVTVIDTNQNVVSQNPLLSCTPGPGAVLTTIALALQGSAADTWDIRPLDVGSCTFAVQDQLSDGTTQTSQTIPIEIHTTSYNIDRRARKNPQVPTRGL